MRNKKKMILALAVVFTMTMLSACGNSNSAVNNVLAEQTKDATTEAMAPAADIVFPDETTEQNTTEQASTEQTDTQAENEPATEAENKEQPEYTAIDVDLTALSSTMVYSEVYNMMYYPDDYRGKVVKMHGVYNAYEDSTTGETYYACIISDATACCAQGMEFLPPALVYPDDFPEQGTEVTITGVYETYTEGEYMYCRLGNARMEY